MKMQHKPSFQRSGVALIVVMFIVLSITAVALVSLRSMQNETRLSTAFRYNRQASQAAHQTATFLRSELNQDALVLSEIAKRQGIEAAMASIEAGEEDKAWEALMSGAKWYYPADVTPFSGLGRTIPGASDTSRLKGDLSRSVTQLGSIGRQAPNQIQIEGFSDGDAFCSFTMYLDAYALVGRPAMMRKNSYFLSTDLNARTSSLKREMAVMNLEPAPCK